MTYQTGKAPRIFFAIIGLIIIGMFLYVFFQSAGPYFYEQYQKLQIERCEAAHAVEPDSWQPIYGFDMGGQYIVGDSPEDRALIGCIVDRLSVHTTAEPYYNEGEAKYPSLSVLAFAFHNGLSLYHYEGQSDL